MQIEKVNTTKKLNIRLIIMLVVLAVLAVIAAYLWIFWDNSDIADDDWYSHEPLELDGDGSPANPYLIRTAEDLDELATKVKAGSSYRERYFVLMNDIDMTEYLSPHGAGYNNGKGFTMIGSHESAPFSGVFDGQGYTIRGLNINRPNEITAVGLFGRIDGAAIYRLNVEASRITAKTFAGALVGGARNSEIIDCSGKIDSIMLTDNVIAGKVIYYGGLIGVGYTNKVINSYLTY